MSLSAAQIATAYQNVLGRAPTASESTAWVNAGASGALTAAQIYSAIVNSAEALNGAAAIIRIYQAAFGRVPDQAGLDQQTDTFVRGGSTINQIAQGFVTSQEFANRYNGGSPVANNAAAVTDALLQSLYQNVLGRAGSAAEIQAWRAALATPGSGYTNAADILIGFSQSPEFTGRAATAVSTFLTAAAQGTAVYSGPLLDPNASTPGALITLTSGVDIRTGTSGADTFDGSVNSSGTATLTSVDQLNGGDGVDLLIGGIDTGNIAPRLTSIENAEVITSGAATLDLINTTGLNALLLRNSSDTLTVNNIASTTATAVSVQDQAADINLNFANAALAGANTFQLNLSGAQSDNNGGAAVVIAQQAGSDTTGLETLTLASGGSNANFLNSVTVQNAAANSTLASLTATGAQGLTIATALNASVRTVDASGMTGAQGLSASFGATAAVTVTGSGGNDTLTFGSNNANSNISAGGGNDTVSISNFDTSDTVGGGDGAADRLDISAANAEAVAANLTNTTGFEQLSLNTAGTNNNSVNATRFGAIDTVRLDAGTAGTYGVTMQAGAVTVAIASPAAGSNAVLGGTLTVTDTGTATTDVLNLTNRDTDTTSTTNNFNGQNITSAGYETVNLNVGATATQAQSVGTITLNNDSLSGANTLNIAGANSVTVGGLTSNSSGLLTVNASGLTGTAALTMGAAPTFSVATGTISITGSANADTLLGAAASASSLVGGAGNDIITGGSAADNIAGDAGNDQITSNGGNDTITGGDGNDTIDASAAAGNVNIDGGAGNDTVTLANTLSALDVINGGDGTDALSITAAATAASAAGVTNFETLTLAAALGGQGLEQFTNNPGFTRLNYGAFNNAVTNAGANINTLSFANGAGTVSMARLVDTSTNAVALQATAAGNSTITALTINDEETVTVSTTSTTAANITITTLNAADLTSLTVSGLGNFEVTNAIGGAANLATVNASGNSGTVTLNASTSTANLTFTGAFSASNNFTGGTGADVLTGGTAADTLIGGNGADTITGGAGGDVLTGGLGADTISGEIGNDTITGGAGNDTVTGGEGADVFNFSTGEGVDTITDFVTTVDRIDVTTGVLGAANAGVIIAAPQNASSLATLFTNNTVNVLTFNGAAANLTNGGTATLSTADLTSTDETNLLAYLNEQFAGATSAANTNAGVLVVNWTAGGSTSSYLYQIVNDSTNNVLQAGEITLLGVIQRGANALVAADII